MKRKRLSCICVFICTLLLVTVPANAMVVNMYVDDTNVQREIVNINGFDMVPIMDIAGELGISFSYDAGILQLNQGDTVYTLRLGQAEGVSSDGRFFGFDIVPQWINGKVMIQLDFIRVMLERSVTWDDVTKTMFIGSDDVYAWIVTTPEYQSAKRYLGIDFETRFSTNPIDRAFEAVISRDYSTYGMTNAGYHCADIWIEETDYVYDQLVWLGAPEGAGKYTWYDQASRRVRAEESAYIPSGGSIDRTNMAGIHMSIYAEAAKEAYRILYYYKPDYQYKYDFDTYYAWMRYER